MWIILAISDDTQGNVQNTLAVQTSTQPDV